jgi:hypothetical protein
VCHAFADPYVEQDSLILLLDLILLKRDVYRHLLYNRGAEPRKAAGGETCAANRLSTAEKQKLKEKVREFITVDHVGPVDKVPISPGG